MFAKPWAQVLGNWLISPVMDIGCFFSPCTDQYTLPVLTFIPFRWLGKAHGGHTCSKIYMILRILRQPGCTAKPSESCGVIPVGSVWLSSILLLWHSATRLQKAVLIHRHLFQTPTYSQSSPQVTIQGQVHRCFYVVHSHFKGVLCERILIPWPLRVGSSHVWDV